MESARQVQEQHGRVVRFVQASSAEIFGEPETSPQNESTPIRPVNPYGAAKAYAHLMVDVHRRRGLHAVSAILYNHESPRRPEQLRDPQDHRRPWPPSPRAAADRLTLGNLDARRDWGWAPDYVDAMVRAARADEPRDYVIATGVGHSVRDFVGAAFRRAGIDDWEGLVDHRPGVGPAGRPDRPHRRRHPRAGAARLGADGRVRRAGRTDGRRRSQARGRGTLSTPTTRPAPRSAGRGRPARA